MPILPGGDEPKIDLTEEEIRRIVAGETVEPSDDAIIAESISAPAPSPTPIPQAAFEALQPSPVVAKPPPPSIPETRTPDTIIGQEGGEARRQAGNLTRGEIIGEREFGEDAGTLAAWAEDFAEARIAFEGGNEAKMKKLANRAIADNNEALMRYVGDYSPGDVKFYALSDEAKLSMAFALDELSYEQGGPFYKAEWSDEEKVAVQNAIAKYRDWYEATPLSEGFREYYNDWIKARTSGIPGPLQRIPFIRELLAPPSKDTVEELKLGVSAASQVLPYGAAARGIIGLKSLGFIAAAQIAPEEGQKKLEEWGVSHELATILSTSTSLALLVAAGVAAPTKEAQKRVSQTILASFLPQYPMMVDQMMDDESPMIDRIMSGVFMTAPAMGFIGAGVRNALSFRGQLRYAVDMAEFEGSTRITTTNEVWRQHGTPTAENVLSIRKNGFDPNKEVYLAFDERTWRHHGDYSATARPRSGLVILKSDSRMFGRLFTEITARIVKARDEAAKRGRDLKPDDLERIEREVYKEYGIDGVEVDAGNRGVIRIFDAKNVEVKDSIRVSGEALNETTRGEEAARPADWGEPDIGLDFTGLEHARALEAWKETADWLERSATVFLKRYPGFTPLFNWVATGSDGLTHPLTFAMTRFLSDRRNYHMRAAHMAETYGSFIRTVFKNTRSGEGGVAEVQLQDGKWYSLDAVMSGLHDSKLTANQRAVVDKWITENEAFHAWSRSEGYEAGVFRARGARGFFPNRRMITAQEGLPRGGGTRAVGRRVPGMQPREFELAEEGVAKKGIEYWGWNNLEGILFDHFFGKFEGVLATKLKKVTDVYSETINDRLNRLYRDVVDAVPESIRRLGRVRRMVETELRQRRDAKAREIRITRSGLQRARQRLANESGRVVGRRQKAKEQGRVARPGARLENARAKVDALEGYLKTLRQELTALPKPTRARILSDPRVQASVHDVAFAKAQLTKVKASLIDHGRETLVQKGPPIIQGRIFSWENYKQIMKKLEQRDPSGWEQVLIELQAIPRVLWATLDHSVGLIHLGGVALAHPIAWFQVMGASMYRLMRGRYPEWVMNHKYFKESLGHGLMVGTINEIRQPGFRRSKAIGFIEERIPVISPAIKATNILFGATGSQARLMLYTLWRDTWFKRGGERALDRLAEHLNKLTGVTASGAAIEAGALFAPRFLRAQLGLMADAFRGKETGTLAREYWARFLLTATLLTVFFNEIQGTPYNLNPLDFGRSLKERKGRPEPFSIPLPTGGRIGILLGYTPIVRGAAHIATGDFGYPISRTTRGKLAPLFNELWTQIEGRTFLGEKVPRPDDNPAEFIKYIAESLLPFAARGIKQDVETQLQLSGGEINAENIAKTFPAIAAEILGGRYRPESITEARFERVQQMIEQVKKGEITLPTEMTALLKAEGDKWVTWSDVPQPIRNAFLEQDEQLRSLNELSRRRQITEETKFAEIIKLTDERNAIILKFGEWAKAGQDDDGKAYTREDYRYDVTTKAQEIRNQIEGVKRELGYENEDVPDDAPIHIRLLDEYARTVVEPAIKLNGELDGEEYEKLYNELIARHAGEKVEGVSIAEILDSLLAERNDAFYREYRRSMQTLRPYFDFLDSTWSAEFIETADLDYIAPNAPSLFNSVIEFEKAIGVELETQLMSGQGFGIYGQVWFDKAKGETYEEHYGPTPEVTRAEAKSIAQNIANAVIRDFYIARDGARDWWIVNQRPDLFDSAVEWGYYKPDKETLDKIRGKE